MITREEIDQAIYATAQADYERQISISSEPTSHQLGKTRNIIQRFLENLPDDACVMELREALTGGRS